MQVAREERHLADVGRPDQPGHDQRSSPIANPPCGGIPCRNACEVARVRRPGPRRGRASAATVVRVAVQPLAAGDQLEAAEEQVEAVGPARVVRLRGGCRTAASPSGSPRPRRSRCRAPAAPRRRAPARAPGRGRARPRAPRDPQRARGSARPGSPSGTSGSVDAEQLDRGPAVARGPRRPCRRAPSRSTAQHVAVVADEAELGVERDVLRQVPHGVVRLGPEHRPDLVDPLEDPDHASACRTAATGRGTPAGRSSRP